MCKTFLEKMRCARISQGRLAGGIVKEGKRGLSTGTVTGMEFFAVLVQKYTVKDKMRRWQQAYGATPDQR